jgi:fructose-bisphosphate aldolase class II
MLQKKLLDQRPDRIKEKLGSKSKVCLLSSKPIFNALRDQASIVMACNTRIKHVIPGIMRAAKELQAVVGYELAKSECNLQGGYTGMTPKDFFETVIDYAERLNYTDPFFIHGDHLTVKSTKEEEIAETEELLKAEIDAGYTSFAIDASLNELDDNITVTSRLAKHVLDLDMGLEVEVGEIKSAGSEGEITTVEEATSFINGLKENGILPNLLAINNGSKHGNYLEGEKIFIDLERTGEIYEAIKDDGVRIAQHGITGTPPHLLGRFADYGIRKGNVGTEWQNIAHQGMPPDLVDEMKRWAKEVGKDIKFANKQFKEEIDDLPKKYREKIADLAYHKAGEFIIAFRAKGTSSFVAEQLAS